MGGPEHRHTSKVLTALAMTAAGSTAKELPRPQATGEGVPTSALPRMTPNVGVLDFTIDTPARRYTGTPWMGTRITPRETAIHYQLDDATAAITRHLDHRGLIDGIASSYSGLRLYGKPLAIGFGRMAAPLRRRGWHEETCFGGHGYFATLGAPDQRHTDIVWNERRVTVTMGTSRSRFAGAQANCAGTS